MVGPGTVHVHGHLSVGATGDVVEENCGAAFTHARQRAAGGREIRFEFHLFGHAQQLLLALEYGQKLAKILISTHRDTLDLLGRCAECRDLARPACGWISNRAARMSQLHDDPHRAKATPAPGRKDKDLALPLWLRKLGGGWDATLRRILVDSLGKVLRKSRKNLLAGQAGQFGQVL